MSSVFEIRAYRATAVTLTSLPFWDQIYYPCLTAKVGAGYGVYIHGNSDTEGALRAIRSIVQGLGWVAVHEPVTVLGTPSRANLEACWDLGATTAATLMPT